MSRFNIHSEGSVQPRAPRYFSCGMAAICSLLRPEFIICAQPPSAFWPVTASEGRIRFIKGSPASKRRAFSRMMAMVAACRSGTWGVQCGVMYTVGICHSGESGEWGCSSNTSSPAPLIFVFDGSGSLDFTAFEIR